MLGDLHDICLILDRRASQHLARGNNAVSQKYQALAERLGREGHLEIGAFRDLDLLTNQDGENTDEETRLLDRLLQ